MIMNSYLMTSYMLGIVLSLFIFYLIFLKIPLRNGRCCDSDLAGDNKGTERLSNRSGITQTLRAASWLWGARYDRNGRGSGVVIGGYILWWWCPVLLMYISECFLYARKW